MVKFFIIILTIISSLFLIIPSKAYSGNATKITLNGNPLTLMGDLLQVGQTLPEINLPDKSLNMVELDSLKGKITILSVVPSLDTPTCEEQTHILRVCARINCQFQS